MSTAVEHGDLQLMAEYDFKTPINATVLFCDSDEDINTSTEIHPNHDSAKNKTREHSILNITEPSSPQRAEELMRNNNNNIANLRCGKTILGEDQKSNSYQITTTSLQGRSESPLGDEPQTPLPHDQVDVNNKANECVQTLLNIVSDHMIFVMKAYIDYKAFTKTISDRIVLENARKQLQKTKYKLFYMSFSAVANIMLPKENDKAFMQNFIDKTIQIGQSKHLYFKHRDMALVCEEMFGWVKSHIQQPLLAGLLNKESTAITGNTNNSRNPVGCDKSYNALDSTYCIFTSGHAGREVTIHASTDFQNNLNVQNDPGRQGAPPASDELRPNAKTTNYMSNYSVQNAPLMQSLKTTSDELRTNANSINGNSHYTEQNMSSTHSVLAPSVKLSNNANLINCTSHYTEQNALSTQSEPSDTLGTKANLTNYISQYPLQNVEPRHSLLPPIEQVKINANSTYYTSHVHAQNFNVRQRAQPASDKFRNNANSTNNIIHSPVQNIPRQSVLPLYRDELRKNATSTNYLQEFEHFNTNYSYDQPAFKNQSKQNQSRNVRVQRETHRHPAHSPHTSRPPSAYYSTQTRHRDTVTTQNYSQNQFVNSTRYDDVQVVQESVEVNRSLSRDSGFMSPLTCAPQDPMYNSPTYDQMDPSSMLTPMITHVTSLNPSVAYIKDGMCHVCGKLTKDKCLGCLKVYYCSQQCQVDDWKNHIYLCNL